MASFAKAALMIGYSETVQIRRVVDMVHRKANGFL